ncbi:MAG: hypothetical protein ACXWUG_18005, partial [Polyangiales bacterium]
MDVPCTVEGRRFEERRQPLVEPSRSIGEVGLDHRVHHLVGERAVAERHVDHDEPLGPRVEAERRRATLAPPDRAEVVVWQPRRKQ